MRQIPLMRKGVVEAYAMVDDEDYDYLTQWNWMVHQDKDDRKRNTSYAQMIRGRQYDGTKKMHRFLMERHHTIQPQDLIDHKDTNGLNNQKVNLRICTSSQNSSHRAKFSGPHSSRFKGVSFDRKSEKWRAELMVNRKRVYFQLWAYERDAAIAYDIKALMHHGEFAVRNFDTVPPEDLARVNTLIKP